MKLSEKNLYEFYRQIGLTHCASLIERENFCAVSGNERSWPQMIFDIHFEENAGLQLNKAFADASEIIDVGFAVCNRKFFTSQDQELLRKNEIYPLEVWQLMEIKLKDYRKFEQEDEYEIRKLIYPTEISAFISLVNSDLMKNLKLNAELLKEFLHHSDAEIYGFFVGNELVSGLLSYTGMNEVAGLYFIVTKNEFRGKGLAAKIIDRVVRLLFQLGFKKVVLQAFPKAVTLYSRMGFTPQGKLIIFWKQQHGPTIDTGKNT